MLPYLKITISHWSNLGSHGHTATRSHLAPVRPKPQTEINIPSTHRRPHLPQALAHPQNPIHKQTIRISLNLKVSEEGVGAEQAEHLVKRIVGLAIWLWRLGGCERWLGGEGVCWAAGARAEGEEGEVADQAGGGLGVEDGVVGLWGGRVSAGRVWWGGRGGLW